MKKQFCGITVTVTATQERVVNKFYKGYLLKEVKVFCHVCFSLLLNKEVEIINCMTLPLAKGQTIDAQLDQF